MRMIRGWILFIIIFMLILQQVSAQRYPPQRCPDGFRLENKEEYVTQALLSCPNASLDKSEAIKCHFGRGSWYLEEFNNRGVLLVDNAQGSQRINLCSNLYLLDISNIYYEMAINLSWSELTAEGLRENPYVEQLVRSLVLATDNNRALEEYQSANLHANHLGRLICAAPQEGFVNDSRTKHIVSKNLNSTGVSASLDGDVDLLSLSAPEIKPTIRLQAVEHLDYPLTVVFENAKGKITFGC